MTHIANPTIKSDATLSPSKSAHTLVIDRRSHATVTGVLDVCSFQENEVIFKIDSGEMILTGQNLHIAKLLLEEGQLHVDGHIDGVIYQSVKHDGKHRFWKRLNK